MTEPDKKSPSDKTPDSQEKCFERPKPQKVLQSENSFHSHLNSIIENVKSTFKKFLNTDLKKPAITSDLVNLISTAEKIVKDFYGGIVKKVTDFANNDLQQFKTMSKEETEKTRKILLQYVTALQKISEEKLKQLMEAKERLQKKLFKREELYSISKFFDVKMTEVKKLTEELYNSLSKGEAAPFVKDLRKMVEVQSNTVKSFLNSFLVAAKESVPKIQESFKSISAKNVLSKMPKIPDNYKLPPSLSKIFIQKQTGCVEEQGTTETVVKKSMVSLKNKLQYNIGKIINSDNIYGRSNVAKATYATIVLFYLYRKFN